MSQDIKVGDYIKITNISPYIKQHFTEEDIKKRYKVELIQTSDRIYYCVHVNGKEKQLTKNEVRKTITIKEQGYDTTRST